MARPGVALVHALRSEKSLDFVAHLRYFRTLLQQRRVSTIQKIKITYAKPLTVTLCPKADTLQMETDTSLAVAVLVHVLVTFLGQRLEAGTSVLGINQSTFLRILHV
jgi:hypothetical protein